MLKDRVLRLYNQGFTTKEIAKKKSVSNQKVIDMLLSFGIDIPPEIMTVEILTAESVSIKHGLSSREYRYLNRVFTLTEIYHGVIQDGFFYPNKNHAITIAKNDYSYCLGDSSIL